MANIFSITEHISEEKPPCPEGDHWPYPPTEYDLYAALSENMPYPMETPLAEPCRHCGSFNMTVGDAYYLDGCRHCYDKAQEWSE